MYMFVYEGGRGVKILEKMATWFVHDPKVKRPFQNCGGGKGLRKPNNKASPGKIDLCKFCSPKIFL